MINRESIEKVAWELKNLVISLKEMDDGDDIKQRGGGDIIENRVNKLFKKAMPKEYSSKRSKKSLEDLIIKDDFIIYLIDVKTHNLGSQTSRPNLIAVNKVVQAIKDGTIDSIYYLFVKYKRSKNNLFIEDVCFYSILELNWDQMSIVSLGVPGQIQMKEMRNFEKSEQKVCKKEWIITFFTKCYDFFEKRSLHDMKAKEEFNRLLKEVGKYV